MGFIRRHWVKSAATVVALSMAIALPHHVAGAAPELDPRLEDAIGFLKAGSYPLQLVSGDQTSTYGATSASLTVRDSSTSIQNQAYKVGNVNFDYTIKSYDSDLGSYMEDFTLQGAYFVAPLRAVWRPPVLSQLLYEQDNIVPWTWSAKATTANVWVDYTGTVKPAIVEVIEGVPLTLIPVENTFLFSGELTGQLVLTQLEVVGLNARRDEISADLSGSDGSRVVEDFSLIMNGLSPLPRGL
jgi:hypothetical protein